MTEPIKINRELSKMSSNVNQNNHVEQSFLLPSPPVPMCPLFQSPFFFLPPPNTYYIQSHLDDQFTLVNSSQYHQKQETTNFTDCKHKSPINLQKKILDYEFIPKNRFINQVIDLSSIKFLPPQEKPNPIDLKCRKHRRWTRAEDHLLYELKTNTKLCWKDIACKFPSRTLGACQLRANKLKKIYKKKSPSGHLKTLLHD